MWMTSWVGWTVRAEPLCVLSHPQSPITPTFPIPSFFVGMSWISWKGHEDREAIQFASMCCSTCSTRHIEGGGNVSKGPMKGNRLIRLTHRLFSITPRRLSLSVTSTTT